ncbi:MAG: hypothetical protein DBY36_05150 [Clostridiales bacterium]|nr:MAG: hypothetical protein DBY36_05150 [Clostridiales bacterium]
MAGATNHGDASGRRTPRPNRTKKGEKRGRSVWNASAFAQPAAALESGLSAKNRARHAAIRFNRPYYIILLPSDQ